MRSIMLYIDNINKPAPVLLNGENLEYGDRLCKKLSPTLNLLRV